MKFDFDEYMNHKVNGNKNEKREEIKRIMNISKTSKTGVLILISILVLGCIGNNNISNNTSNILSNTSTPVYTPIKTVQAVNTYEFPIKIIKTNVSSNVQNITNKSSNLSASWCKPKTYIITYGKQFTVQGLVLDRTNTQFCYAISVQSSNGTNTTIMYYFNQDKTIEALNLTSTFDNGSSSISSSSSITR